MGQNTSNNASALLDPDPDPDQPPNNESNQQSIENVSIPVRKLSSCKQQLSERICILVEGNPRHVTAQLSNRLQEMNIHAKYDDNNKEKQVYGNANSVPFVPTFSLTTLDKVEMRLSLWEVNERALMVQLELLKGTFIAFHKYSLPILRATLVDDSCTWEIEKHDDGRTSLTHENKRNNNSDNNGTSKNNSDRNNVNSFPKIASTLYNERYFYCAIDEIKAEFHAISTSKIAELYNLCGRNIRLCRNLLGCVKQLSTNFQLMDSKEIEDLVSRHSKELKVLNEHYATFSLEEIALVYQRSNCNFESSRELLCNNSNDNKKIINNIKKKTIKKKKKKTSPKLQQISNESKPTRKTNNVNEGGKDVAWNDKSALLREREHNVPNNDKAVNEYAMTLTPPEACAVSLSDESSTSQKILLAAHSPHLPVATVATKLVQPADSHMADHDETPSNAKQATCPNQPALGTATTSSSIQLGGGSVDLYNEDQVGTSESLGGKSCGFTISQDEPVHNDVLKVVMVGSAGADGSSLVNAICQSTRKDKRQSGFGVIVQTWHPENQNGPRVKFEIWDTQGNGSTMFYSHPRVQSLFFSSRSLYLLTWDLAVQNVRPRYQDNNEEKNHSNWNKENELLVDEGEIEEYLGLVADVENRVLSLVDCIARKGPESAILPVVIVSKDMDETEIKRRCDLMQRMLLSHVESFQGDGTAPKLLACADSVISINLSTNKGTDQLRESIIAAANDNKQPIFAHVGAPIPSETSKVMKTIRQLKKVYKLVMIDHLMAELDGAVVSTKRIREALHFSSSIGELLYFGGEDDGSLSGYVILCLKWFTSVLSCVLHNVSKRELANMRHIMNLECNNNDQEFPESDNIDALYSGSNSNCPLLTAADAKMLWQSMSHMHEAVSGSSNLSEDSTTSSIFDSLLHILVQSGVLVPTGLSRLSDNSELYFIPSLLTIADSSDVWAYKSSCSWKTTLCHSWLFRDGAPSDMMEHIMVPLLRDLVKFSRKYKISGETTSETFPMPPGDFSDRRDATYLEQVTIHEMMCWKSSVLVKVGCIFVDTESGECKESFVEIFVSIQDESWNCIAPAAVRRSMHRFIVCGKGQVGFHGRHLWEGGYRVVVESINSSLTSFSNVHREVFCPDCLAQSSYRSASTWGLDNVRVAASTGISEVRCFKGHSIDADLICSTCNTSHEPPPWREMPSTKPVQELLNSIVLVCLWDDDTKAMCRVGSGFFIDKKLGLIVTAGHVLFNMEPGRNFGMPYFGLRTAKVMIGVISNDCYQSAEYRYSAEIVAENIKSIDACVLRLTGRLKKDMDQASMLGDYPETLLDPKAIERENLQQLEMTTCFELEETVRILGYNQGGEGVLTEGMHINQSADFAKGYICKRFQAALHYDDGNRSTASTCSIVGFTPREEIVIMCPTIGGHSGGPGVNNDGEVVGILSRCDPVDRQRCYLVPSSEIIDLVSRARKCLTV